MCLRIWTVLMMVSTRLLLLLDGEVNATKTKAPIRQK